MKLKSFNLKLYFQSLLLVITTSVVSQEGTPEFNSTFNNPDESTWETLKSDAELMFGGLKYTYSRPFQWQNDDIGLFLGTAIGTAGLNLMDEEAHQFFRDQEEDVPGVIKEFGWYFGSPQNNYGVTGLIYFTGLFTKSPKIRRTGILMISAASSAGLIQTISKNIAGRARPGDGRDRLSFKPFSKEGTYHSFPSGHTILSFTTFYALSKQFESPWVKGGLYLAGMVSPVSRLWQGAHWLTDVALSMALTIAVVDSVDKYLDQQTLMKNNPELRKETKVSWHLTMGAGTIGVVGKF
ncbi:phosphatase PAP2 family protein [Zunongwangia sp. HGR-M22]|uniref:phosphatase PAP2 family protein n=1 Tax=Zunongwangia sp. HGR-M22 TaxID=3015168 RepID=UPI0022DDD5D6|nr:phosphatase PAP2 family protein [Zunongwangia sp. HGR-M22]WBL27295.1 phosphatase PAP2 family protein [Zunongwangia sp. HGR-M22]